MFPLILLFFLTAQEPTPSPAEVEKAIIELRNEIRNTKVELEAFKQAEIRKEVNRTAERVKRAERRVKSRRGEFEAAKEKLREHEETGEALKKSPVIPQSSIIALRPDLVLAEVDETLLDANRISKEHQKVFLAVVAERAALKEKIARANRRWHCRWLRIGCIGRK